jgi:hypothetical protein
VVGATHARAFGWCLMGISNLSTGLRPGVCTSTTRPSTPFEGQMIYETDTNRVLVYEGAAWVMIADTDTPPGLELVKVQTVGSAVASVTVSNVFSSTYDNYRITYMGGSASAANNLAFQFGPSSVSGYNTSYYQVVHYSFYNGSSSNNVAGSSNAANWPYIGYHDTDSVRFSADICNPNAAEWASIMNAPYLAPLSTGFCVGTHQSNGAFTDFTLTPGSGTLTGGTIRVYGYRNTI